MQNGQLDYMLREIVLRTALPFHRLVPSWFPGARARQERVAAIVKVGEEQSAVIQEAVHAAMATRRREEQHAHLLPPVPRTHTHTHTHTHARDPSAYLARPGTHARACLPEGALLWVGAGWWLGDEACLSLVVAKSQFDALFVLRL